eukprot:gnl/MRDRNA2_/MRDRNA2_92454_c0_seq1.p1 gnl/MRDRNA2_/MRDRNA2_92454_c0~~gnl/MRDRNA2_/MRDRNA2_92454_c0_seq1.p1  ORF type:complete len:968 (+),score=190.46 gnl/MRDRNA2_/MRDRNA2_92454_c0_seq1:96-2906(+)
MAPGPVVVTEPAVDTLEVPSNGAEVTEKRGSMFTEGRRSMVEDPLLKQIQFDDDGAHAPRVRHRHTPVPDLAPHVCWQQLESCGSTSAPLKRRNHAAVGYQDQHGNERFIVMGGECQPKPRGKEMKVMELKESPAAQKSLDAPPEWEAHYQIMREEFPKRLHSFTANVVGSSIVMFGGLDIDKKTPTNSVMVYNTETNSWRQQDGSADNNKRDSEDAPEPRFEHAAASLDGDRRMLVHGGRDYKEGKPLHNVFCLEVGQRSLRWNRIRLKGGGGDRGGLGGGPGVRTLPLPGRRAHSLCLAGDMSRAFLFGGCSDNEGLTSVNADLFVMVIDKCTSLIVESENYRGQAPEPRAYHTAVLIGPFMAVFGGKNRRGEPYNDFHLLHLASMIWTSPVTRSVPPAISEWPEPRWGHAAVAISRTLRGGEGIREGMLIFGGQGVDQAYDDVWGVYFEAPSENSAPVRHMADALGAFTDQILCSLRDRFLHNIFALRNEQTMLFQDLLKSVEQSREEVKACESILVDAQNSAVRTDKDLQIAEQREEQVKDQLVEQQEEAKLARDEAVEELAEAENEIARLQAMLMRLEGSQNIFTADKLIDFSDVDVCQEDSGIELCNKAAPTGQVHRCSGHWKGSLCTVETIELFEKGAFTEERPTIATEKSTGNFSTLMKSVGDSPQIGMQRRLQLAAQTKQRKRWETATRQELHIISRLRHPCLVEYYGAASDGERLLLLSEPPLIPLSQRLVEEPPFEELDKLDVALDLIHAIEYLHCKGITHRHITEENIFLKDLPHIAVKLGGLLPSRLTCRATGGVFVPSSYQPPPTGSSILVPTQDEATDPRKADIFGYGALLMHLYSGHKPDPGKALRSMVQIVDKIVDKSIQMVVMKCMEKDPAHRPSARMVLRALAAVADGEVAGMDPQNDDLSCHTPLADNMVNLDDDE